MTFRLQFFSGFGSDGSEFHGYDGRTSVDEFRPQDLPAIARSMGCVFGPVVCIVTSPGGAQRAYPFHITSEA